VRCPECRTTFFHKWLNRVIDGDRVTCPPGREARNFHGIVQMHNRARGLHPSRGRIHELPTF